MTREDREKRRRTVEALVERLRANIDNENFTIVAAVGEDAKDGTINATFAIDGDGGVAMQMWGELKEAYERQAGTVG